jgi:hypothetical protein
MLVPHIKPTNETGLERLMNRASIPSPGLNNRGLAGTKKIFEGGK